MSSSCSDCTTRPCHVCHRCLFKHCECATASNGLCLESQPCNCISATRCRLCHGCRDVTLSHCNCDQHAKGLCLCEALRANAAVEDPNIESTRQDILWRTALPRVQTNYTDRNEREQPFLSKRHVFDMISNQRFQMLRPRNGIRGLQRGSYIATLEPDNTTVPKKRASNRDSAGFYDRALTNYERISKQDEAMPNEELVDYIVHCASLKTSNVPELWGTFDTSAAIVSAIVVEEYTKQLVDDYIARGHTHVLTSQEQLQDCVLDLLNGAVCEPDCTNDLEAAIVSELTNVFGHEAIQAFDLPKLIRQIMNPLMDNVEENDPKWKQWKNERIQQGIEALQDGAVISPDGIHVDITQGIPSYWFCVALPHGKENEMIASERYPSYQLAFETKLQLEQRIMLNKKTLPTNAPISIPIGTFSKAQQHPWQHVQRPLTMPSIQEMEGLPNVKKVLEKVAIAQRGLSEAEAHKIEIKKRLTERGYVRERPAKKQSKYIYKRRTMSAKAKEKQAAKLKARHTEQLSFRALLGGDSTQDSYSDDDEEEDNMEIECWCPKCGNDIRHKSKSSQTCEVFKFWKSRKESTMEATTSIPYMDDPADLFFHIVNEWRHNEDNSLFHV